MHHGILKILPLMALFASLAPPAAAQRHDNILDVARSAGQFNTLLAALDAAGLTPVIGGKGPFTVFAPTDEAFAKLPAGTVESLLEEENLPKLAEILKYHVVEGRVYADQALKAREAETLAGYPVQIGVADGSVRVNSSGVTATDIDAANGVIHIIDAVLLPPEEPSAYQAAWELMQLAIDRGVPLYNSGNAEACAAIYEVAATALLQMGETIPYEARQGLRRSLRAIQGTHNMSDRAWTLREALDETMRQMRMMAGR
jgi:uncharacterized surface protein with fasciclin (FAS1) repeats